MAFDRQSEKDMPLSALLTPLPLLKRSGGVLLRGMRVTIAGGADKQSAPAYLELGNRSGTTMHELGCPGQGGKDVMVFIPEVSGDERLTAIVRCGSETWDGALRIRPARRWTVHLVLHSHTDLGFTDTISEISKIHNDNTDRAIELCHATADWPEGSRFKWTCEVSWQVQQYIEHRSPEKVEELMRLVRQRSIGIGAMYTGQLPDILGHEEAARTFSYAGHLRHRYGIVCDTAMLCDVPGFTTGMVQIMAKSGVPNLIIADNNFIAPVLARTDLPRPFWWNGADGTRILCWYTDHPYFAYIEGEYYGFTADVDAVAGKLPEKLRSLEESGYPFDRLQVQYAFDNFRLDTRPIDIVRKWNEAWEYPKVVLSTADEFMNHLRRSHADEIPSRTGDWTNWWAGISSGFPVEAALSRRCHERAPAAEILWTAASMRNPSVAYPADEFNRVYDGLLAFDEHSGGGTLWQPKSPEHQEAALREGFGYLYNADRLLGRLESEIVPASAGGRTFAVINPSGESRSGWVASPSLVHGGLYADHVPPYGYRTYPTGDEVESKLPGDGNAGVEDRPAQFVLVNSHMKVVIDKKSGFCTSVRDVRRGRELLSGETYFNRPKVYEMHPVVQIELGRYIPEVYTGVENPGDFLPWPELSRPGIDCCTDPVRGVVCTISHAIGGLVWLTQEYVLPHDASGVFVSNRLSRDVCDDRRLRDALGDYLRPTGLLYFCFSFNVPDGMFEYESPASIIRPSAEQFQAACRDFFAIGRWCRISGAETSVAVSSPDVPLVDVGSVGLLRFKPELDANQSSLFFRAVSLKDWGSDLESPYSRDRDLVFRFGVDAEDVSGGAIEARRTGRAHAHSLGLSCHSPLRGAVVASDATGLFTGPAGSWCSVTPENVEIMTIKRARHSSDILIRCREIAGRSAKASIAFSGFRIKAAHSASITEVPLDPVDARGDVLRAEFSPFAIHTYLLTLQRHEAGNDNA